MALYELDGVKVKTPGPGRFWVAENAVVAGNVEIGDDVSIWFGSVVRPLVAKGRKLRRPGRRWHSV